ncbi:hypothetical protein, variant [Cladophialophora immunda]|uniref:Xylanolytic transcriptional activator regulatory domain-containing protein n=1 Tax=Cladophialophora immunda TaxID=569365 RepID=A0A0D2CGX0_9EURO|nr:uncharacterized protein PV07_05249 [Cladophialophora immunda]XP_016249651.1 hypothetical protein, variant [Cladophialophora immunda]KIW29434.1 hypothetical protein PV07_05249 [Cladophialophora immunda]KIW29435.1 hypothetical protein, variant [Cladophialophora immunda]
MQSSTSGSPQGKPFPFKGNGIFGGNYSLSFFSDSRMQALSTRLQNSKLDDLVKRVAEVVSHRLRSSPQSANGSILVRSNDKDIMVNQDTAAIYIKAYFQRVHPFYPFLDQTTFEQNIADPDFSRKLSTNKALSALYHSVLALGCQHCRNGSFEPGKSRAWQLFSVALSLFPDLLTLPDSLLTLQALTSMAIFTLSVSCIQIEHIIISEGARRAQQISFGQLTDGLSDTYGRVFWVLYTIEKTSSFYYGRSSIFNDSDIGHPVPAISESSFNGFNWFLASARHARLLSRAYSSLFSIGVTGNSWEYFGATIDQLYSKLEDWRLSIPEEIRPGTAFWEQSLPGPLMPQVALWTHYLYHSLLLALARATLHLGSRTAEGTDLNRLVRSKQEIMKASRAILELTRLVEVEPYTPVWALVGIPVAALFVLFDLIIHNPKHPETGSNLALLHVASGHFSRIEYASGGSLPGSMVSEFAFIASEYVKNVQQNFGSDNLPETLQRSTLAANSQNVDYLGASYLPISSPEGQFEMPSANDIVPTSQTSGPEISGVFDDVFYPIHDGFYNTQNGSLGGTNLINLFGSAVPGVSFNVDPWNDVGGGWKE